MKLDMHCHTKEGSIDAKVGIKEYIEKLKKLGFDGMLITDHNSYKGYDYWENTEKSKDPFVVLKGIEYDTKDAGHIIAVLPEGVYSKLLELRGMTVMQLEKVVHKLGGILGPAHPYGNGFFAVMNTKIGKKNKELVQKFDFIEAFNACTKPFANEKAKALARNYKKTMFSGSDAHRETVIGTAFTEFFREINNNDDLIAYVKGNVEAKLGGEGIWKETNRIREWFGKWGYWIYNKLGTFIRKYSRKKEFHKFVKQDIF
ncbi:MAG: PHP domain-containing protein [Acetivibrio sp.]